MKDKHAGWLAGLGREVNTVFNYCNELSAKVYERERRFLSGFLQRFAVFSDSGLRPIDAERRPRVPTDGGGLVSYNACYVFEAGADARDETPCNLEIDDHECH